MSARAAGMSLVIATRSRPGTLRDTLASLRRCDPLPGELLVVDGDPDGSAAPVVAEHADQGTGPRATHVVSPPGLPRQRNRGIDTARGDIVVFADDDVGFDPGVFGALARAYDEPATIGATGWVIEADDRRVKALPWVRRLLGGRAREGTMTSYGFPRRLTSDGDSRDVEFVHGCLMSARREAARSVRFDERLRGYALLEDEDFGLRLSRAGRVRFVADARVVHVETGRRSMDRRAFNRTLVVHRAYLLEKNFRPTRAERLRLAATIGLIGVHRAVNGELDGVAGLVEGAAIVLRGTAEPEVLAAAEPNA